MHCKSIVPQKKLELRLLELQAKAPLVPAQNFRRIQNFRWIRKLGTGIRLLPADLGLRLDSKKSLDLEPLLIQKQRQAMRLDFQKQFPQRE